MTDLASTGIVESTVTDPQRRKDFLDPSEIKTFLEAAKAGRQGGRDHLDYKRSGLVPRASKSEGDQPNHHQHPPWEMCQWQRLKDYLTTRKVSFRG